MPYSFDAVKGQQRIFDYYQVNLTYGEVATLVALPEDFLGNELFNHELTMQRQLTWKRIRDEMVPYLVKNEDAFYSALTLIMVPRDLSSLEEDDEGYEFEAERTSSGKERRIGTLTVHSNLVLFPADGQHRVASIKEAIREDHRLANVTLPVVLIPFKRRSQVRQLFSDLNRNVRVVNKSVAHSFETRDPIALIAKEQETRVPLFRSRVNHASNSLSATSDNVITVNTLYNFVEQVLPKLGYDAEALRGDNDAIGKAAERVAIVFGCVVAALPYWAEVEAGPAKPNDARANYVFAHGIGWQAIGQAVAALIHERPKSWEKEIQAMLTAVGDWSRSNSAWQGVAMVGERMNNTGPGIRATAGYILKSYGLTTGDASPLIAQYEKSIPAGQTA